VTESPADITAQERVRILAEAALELKAQKPVALNVRELTSFADAFLILTGTSNRHVRSIADAVIQASKKSGQKPLGVEGEDEGRWVLIDLGDVVVHIFLGETREYYDLDRLWEDAPSIELPSGGDAAA